MCEVRPVTGEQLHIAQRNRAAALGPDDRACAGRHPPPGYERGTQARVKRDQTAAPVLRGAILQLDDLADLPRGIADRTRSRRPARGGYADARDMFDHPCADFD